MRDSQPLASAFDDVALPSLPALPGMTSAAECRYLYWLATSQRKGRGALVEIGTWLGRSSLHLAAGLRASAVPGKLHAFDDFVWRRHDRAKADLGLRSGQSFQPHFEANLEAYRDLLVVQRSKIAALQWRGGPIEILFLDAPKRQRTLTQVLEIFGPHLIPGHSLIALQDYLHFPSYALAAALHTLGDRLSLSHVVLGGSTVTFRLRKAIDLAADRPADWAIHRWTRPQAEAAWRAILAPLPAPARERLQPAAALHLYDIGQRAAAVAAFKALPMTSGQSQKIAQLSRSHHYLNYPELFQAAGHPGSLKQRCLTPAKRLHNLVRRWSGGA